MSVLGNFNKPIDSIPLAVFGILYGLVIILQVASWMKINLIQVYFVDSQYNFPYELFSFIQPLPAPVLNLLLVILMIGGLMVLLGWYYRQAIIAVTVLFSYFFLLDKSYYNNHYYLFALIGFLLCFVDADRRLALRKTGDSPMVPRWQLWILQAQIVLVYFFAGLAKINPEWLAGEPLRTFLQMRPESALLGDFLRSETAVYFLVYAGLIFDLFIGFLLLIRKTFWWAVAGVLIFNFTNHWLFLGDIGVFPLFMIAATTLFIPEEYYRKWFKLSKEKKKKKVPAVTLPQISRLTLSTLGIYFMLQILLPLRHYLYPGNPEWTGEGHRFAWRMKMVNRKASVKFLFRDQENDRRYPVDLKKVLGPGQLKKMNYAPEMVVQFAHYIKKEMQAGGIQKPLIFTEYKVSWNSKPFQLQISDRLNLAETTIPVVGPASWILPYQKE